MKLRQIRSDTSTAPVPSRLAGDDACAAAKPRTEAVIGSPQPDRIAALRSGGVAGAISAAALAAAHRVSRFHAEARAAHRVPPAHAGPGAGRAGSAASQGRPDARGLTEGAVSLPAQQAAA